MSVEVIIEEEVVKLEDYRSYRCTDLSDEDYYKSHSDVLDVYDRLTSEMEWGERDAIIYTEKYRVDIIELMTLNGLNPYDTIDTIKHREA